MSEALNRAEDVSRADEREENVSWMSDLMALTKARLTTLVLVTTFVGFCLASGPSMGLVLLVHVLVGTALVAAGASVFNQLMEIESDSKMRRTSDRPLPAGRMQLRTAVWLAVATSMLGLVQLGLFVNGLAASMAALTLFVYAAVYTPMKQTSSACTLVGAVSGALPPLIGWAAGGGQMDGGALALFGVLFFWQLPHFVSINWVYREEYEKAGFAMWSNGDVGGRRSALLCVAFSVLLLGVGLAPSLVGITRPGYMIGAVVLGLVMLAFSIQFFRVRDVRSAKRLFYWSIIYLPLILGLMLYTKTPYHPAP